MMDQFLGIPVAIQFGEDPAKRVGKTEKKGNTFLEVIPGELKKSTAFERLLLPEYISYDILRYLIKWLTWQIIFRNFSGYNWALRSDSVGK